MDNLIIIGAARSGTNILRDTLLKIPGYVSWNCDEINPIWRHGNLDKDHDILTSDNASLEVINYVNKQFNKLSQKNNKANIIEKTCANSLRVPFVYRVMPNAKYIFIIRDGRDVIASAMRRWTSNLDLKYTLKKLNIFLYQTLLTTLTSLV